jgi:hypothetical protein
MLPSLPFFTPDQRRLVVSARDLQPLVGRLFPLMTVCEKMKTFSPPQAHISDHSDEEFSSKWEFVTILRVMLEFDRTF